MTAVAAFGAHWATIERIDGWLERNSAAVLDSMLSAQDELKIPAHGVLEIGVWKGRSAALLASQLRDSEDMFLVDSWLQKDTLVENLRTVMGTRMQKHAITLLQGTASEVPAYLAPGKKFRLTHIDADHTAAGLRADLALAKAVTDPAGLIVIDDIFNYLYPQLIGELFHFLSHEGRDFCCLLIAFNKAYLCRTRWLDLYGDWIFHYLTAFMEQRGVAVTLCRTTDKVEWPGFTLVDYLGMSRRGLDGRNDYIRP